MLVEEGGLVATFPRNDAMRAVLAQPAEEAGTKAGRASQAPRRRDSAHRAGWQYQLPQPYRELLERAAPGAASASSRVVDSQAPEGVVEAAADGSGGNGAAHAESGGAAGGGDADASRQMWRDVSAVARGRLQEAPPDQSGWERHAARLHEGLWVEELGVTLELRRRHLTVGSLPEVGDGLFRLDLGELSDQLGEGALLRGVRIAISCAGGHTYRATPQSGASNGMVLLAADPGLAAASGPFDVEFHPQRFQQVAMHRALDVPQAEVLFNSTPSSAAEASPAGSDGLPASLNEAQQRAVAAALDPAGSHHPLVVWGPPGTGKSTLAAFIVWHLVKQRPTRLHILVASPSNTGADVLCAKLAKMGLDADQMLRLNALGRSYSTVPEALLPFCAVGTGRDDRPTFVIPPLERVSQFKVVVTTCICAAHLCNALRANGGDPNSGWFSHVLVDEAGEATEPETMVPLALLRPVAGRAMLLGDHFQLGPLVLSPLANRLAMLERSMIERLANERFEAVRSSERKDLTQNALLECEGQGLFFLTESYRSHPGIMELYSQIFYSGQLEHRERASQNALASFFNRRGRAGPVVLHNVVGQERREGRSPSVYNVEEVRAVQSYLVDLLMDGSLELRGSDVGIIAPYTKQVQAMEKQIATLGPQFEGVECGTVEHFQGQERRVVILSTVRSSRGGGEPSGRPIGFLANPKRLNVAISRAVAGLIVVGDLQALSAHSAHWRRLVQMGKEMGAVTGEPLGTGRAASPACEADEAAASAADAPPDAMEREQARRPVPAVEQSAALDAVLGG